MDEDDFDDFDEEDSLLGSNERQGEEVEPWNSFQIIHRKPASGSTVETKFIDNGTIFLKIATIFGVGLVVLLTAVTSKGLLLFMTSQVKKNVTRQYCNRGLDASRQYVFSMPDVERSTWIWLLIFAYCVPEVGTFIRSLRILVFKSRSYPHPAEFLALLVTESLPAIGSSLLVFNVLPEIDVIRGAMLTNAMSVVPGLELILFNMYSTKRSVSMALVADIAALIAQVSAFVAWPLLADGDSTIWLIPVSTILISFGWWENFISETSAIEFVRNMAKSRKSFPNSKYFSYAIISILKCCIFFATTVASLYIREGTIGYMFNNFTATFGNHRMMVTEVIPTISGISNGVDDAVSSGVTQPIYSDITLQLSIWFVCIATAYICYAFAKFSCKIMIQGASFAFPIGLVVPVLITGLVIFCGYFAKDECAFHGSIPSYLFFNAPPLTYLNDFIGHQYAWVWLLWLVSQIWITRHIWSNKNSKLATTEQIFMRPMYHGILIDQSIAMNRRNVAHQLRKDDAVEGDDRSNIDVDKITRIFACATMWHETPEEMMEFLKSIFRMDEDQAAHRIVKQYLQYPIEGYYEWETHIFFDDAFWRKSADDNDPELNTYVKDLIATLGEAANEVHKTTVRIRPPIIYSTPYGGRLVWTLPGKTKVIAHLKDKAKIRAKKRWSQVMYMYYLLGHKIVDNDEYDETRVANRSKNTFLLALDGDIDFQPDAVHLLIQYMKKNDNLGAACGRIHPVGSGAMAWYQIFEYAVGHWMQKATEHVIGCVLCSPGCFSLFRAGALMDHNVMARYTTRATEARHYVQYDQGEDRWLCTLLLQRGYRVEYSAASDAYTHCPEGFNEFYNQRRRWMPSTMANILDLLEDSDHIKEVNDDISTPYIWYQMILMVGTVIGPGTIFLMLVGAFVTVFNMSQYSALWCNVAPILLYVLVSLTCESKTQLLVAAILSAGYGLVMMMVFIGVAMQINEDGILAPSSLFFFLMMGEYIIAALVHPKEFYCLKYGVIYLMTVPSMYMLLVIYSVFNMNNVSWGTREVTVAPKAVPGEPKKPEKKKASMVVETLHKVRDFFMSCSSDPKHLLMINDSLMAIREKVDHIDQKVLDLETITLDPDAERPRKSTWKSGTTMLEGTKPSKMSVHSRPSALRKKSTLDKHGGIYPNSSLVDEESDDDDSLDTLSDDLQNNNWLYSDELIRGHVTFLEKKEELFWKKLLDAYLHPVEDDKEKVARDLKDLRDRMAMSFFFINIIFVVVVFLLTIKKEILHLQWPFNPKVNFTYSSALNVNEIIIQKTYLELEPIGFVFLIFFFLLMGIQFFGMLVHRFGTFSQIMANTDVEFGKTKIENMTEDELLRRDPLKTFKKLIKLKGVNGDDEKEEDVDAHVSRRKTVADLAKNKDKKRAIINDLDSAFQARMAKIRNGEETDVAVPRKTLQAIHRRRSTVMNIRKSQLRPFNPNAFRSFPENIPQDNSSIVYQYDNPTFDGTVDESTG
ncbi:chitin synthase chs-2 [Dendroctonus ponderosae]|uniref:chitin synthase chs-2 n=1 Tax=Dendroctonus ponderosae TaxID=77166 RepID=UPI0020357A3A|nr:chitin synthase chs-2 [Dendroctonus ponderosae]